MASALATLFRGAPSTFRRSHGPAGEIRHAACARHAREHTPVARSGLPRFQAEHAGIRGVELLGLFGAVYRLSQVRRWLLAAATVATRGASSAVDCRGETQAGFFQISCLRRHNCCLCFLLHLRHSLLWKVGCRVVILRLH